MQYEKEGRSLVEWENRDLTLDELKVKLEALKEANDDQDLIDQLETEIAIRTLGESTDELVG